MIKSSNHGAVQVLAIEGPLNEEEAARLSEQIESIPRTGRPQLVIDLSESPLIDSVGCEALLDCRDAISQLGGAIYLAGLTPLSQDILAATGVIRFFQSFASDKQAIAQFAR